MSDQSFTKTFYIIPYHIRKLPGMTLALLDFYETIFEFLNNGKDCFLTNEKIMQRTNIKSDRTLKDAFRFFEKHNELKRVFKDKKRYIVRVNKIECEMTVDDHPVDNSMLNCTNTNQTGGGNSSEGGYSITPRGGQCITPPGGVAEYPHNINNLNINNLNKERGETQKARSPEKPLSIFKPNEENQILCKDLRLNFDEEVKSFMERHKGKRNQYEFERWLKNSRSYHDNKNRKKDEVRSTIMEYGPGHHAWEMHRKFEREKKLNNITSIKGNIDGSDDGRSNTTDQSRGTGLRKAEEYLLQGSAMG